MGFVSFVKKLFGAKTEVSETTQVVEELQPVTIDTTTSVYETLPPPQEEILVDSSVVESQITDAVTTTPTEDVVETVKSNKKVVIKKRNYKPKTNVTKKSVPSNRKRVK